MNFDNSLRAAMSAAPEPADLAIHIHNRVSRFAKAQRVRGRVLVTLGATAAAVVALVLFPTMRAQASLNRISDALSAATQMVASRYILDAQGRRVSAGSATFSNGSWLLQGRPDIEDTLLINGRRYVHEKFTNCYIVSSGPAPSKREELQLSAKLKAWHFNVELGTVTMDGQRLIEAILTGRDRNERKIIYADPQTDLPVKSFLECFELGRWRRVTETDFSYATITDPGRFALDPSIPKLSQEQWRQRVARAMLSKELSRHTFKNQDLVVRSLDVSHDGTVFLSFQSGQTEAGSGYGFTLSDDLATVYEQRKVDTSGSPLDTVSHKEGGRIELAVFVPVNRPATWRPRRLTLSAHIGDKGEFVRLFAGRVEYADGHLGRQWSINRTGADASATYRDVQVLERTVTRPTCEDRPTYLLAVGNGEWATGLTSELAKAESRARYFRDQNDVARERLWLEQELRLMNAIESQGGGPYARAGILEELRRNASRLPG